jgi:alkanesulfonate monooxygenase SsuD/methylene tetrahydromethanopterin reductase-like flavin-dependent oxidoreductase (luciferase family)
MSSEFNELLPVAQGERAQLWIIGTRDQVIHLMNELYVRKVATDRVQFTPIIPAPFASGKYMTVLVR